MTEDIDASVEKQPSVHGDINTVIQFDGVLHRFHRTELRPINFGLRQDCLLLIAIFCGIFSLFHLISILVWIFEKKMSFGEISNTYFSDKTLMTGLLLTCWFIGYNICSYAIWAQFESQLDRDAPPDDFEFLSAEEALDTGLAYDDITLDDPKLSKMASQTLLVTVPSGELVIGTNTRSQSHESLRIMHSDK